MYNNTIDERNIFESNIISLNDKAKLVSKSLAQKIKCYLWNIYLSQPNSMINIDKVSCQVMNVWQILKDLEPLLKYVTNDFYFDSNMKIEYSKKRQNNLQQEINRGNPFKSEVPGGVPKLADGKNGKKKNSKFSSNTKTFLSSSSNSTKSP